METNIRKCSSWSPVEPW